MASTSARPTFRGAVVVDGWLFTGALPDELRNLTTPGRDDSIEERAANAARYDLRSAYAYRTHGRPDTHRRRRLVGPAVGGHVVCANDDRSQGRDVTLARHATNCEEGVPCSCSHVVTVIPEDFDGLDQWPLLGTTAWQKTYYRRVQVESVNSQLKKVFRIVRGAIMCVDDDKTRLLRALAACAVNLRRAHNFRIKHRLPDPWGPYQDHLVPVTGPVDPAPAWQSEAEISIPGLIDAFLARTPGRDPDTQGTAEPV